MRVLGYDPASVLAGWAVVDSGVPQQIGIWEGVGKPLDRLADWDKFSGFLIQTFKPDMVTMEVIRVSVSHDTTRSLSRHEAVFIVRARDAGAICIEYQVGQARAAVFGKGNGNMKKDVAFVEMKKRYPDLDWKPKTRGGTDQSDALTGALAATTLAERR